MEDTTLFEMFDRLLADVSSAEKVRTAEATGSIDGFWEAIEASGFLDVLLSEEQGGAGLSVAQAIPLIQSLGRYAAPGPVAQTMIARSLLAEAGVAAPAGPIILVSPQETSGTFASISAYGGVARHALLDLGEEWILASQSANDTLVRDAGDGLGSIISWPDRPVGLSVEPPPQNLRQLSALIHAAEIVGLATRVLEMTVAYANERSQFGKPIGRQQVIQQNLTVMAEQVTLTRMAVQIGAAGTGIVHVAIAKQIASKAASLIADQAHAVFGAIGMSKEHDLQIYTRRLRAWRLAEGAESYWARQAGQIFLSASSTSVIDEVRQL